MAATSADNTVVIVYSKKGNADSSRAERDRRSKSKSRSQSQERDRYYRGGDGDQMDPDPDREADRPARELRRRNLEQAMRPLIRPALLSPRFKSTMRD